MTSRKGGSQGIGNQDKGKEIEGKVGEAHWSMARSQYSIALLQIGHCHVGACSWSCRNVKASKHALWVQEIERHGLLIREIERGHFSVITEDVVSMSASALFWITVEFGASALCEMKRHMNKRASTNSPG